MCTLAINAGAMLVVFFFLLWFNFHVGGLELLKKGFGEGAKFFIPLAMIVIPLALMAGQIRAMHGRNPEIMRGIVSGRFAVLKSLVVGVVVPGGMSAGPVLQEEWSNGGCKLAIIVLLMSSGLMNWTGILIKLPFLGTKITGALVAVAFCMTAMMVFLFLLWQQLKT